MIAMFLRNLSCIRSVCKHIVEQDGLVILRELMGKYNSRVLTSAAMLLFHNLSKDAELHSRLCDEGVMDMIKSVTGATSEAQTENDNEDLDSDEDLTVASNDQCPNADLHGEKLDTVDRKSRVPQDSCYDMVMTIQLISLTPECRSMIVENGSIVKVFFRILSGLNDVIRHEMVCSLCNLASSRECREDLVAQGAVELLVTLSETPYADTQAQCATALGYLSENTRVETGTCASLLLLSLKDEEMRENATINGSGPRKSVMVNDDHSESIASNHTNVSAPAKELLALQNVKSLKVMIRDGLGRHQDKHGVLPSDVDTVTAESKSLESFRGTSLEDLNVIGYTELTPHEKEVLKRDYSKYEYVITSHTVTQERGGVSHKKRVELPYPCIENASTEIENIAVGGLCPINVSKDSLPKMEDEPKILEGKSATSGDFNEKYAPGRQEKFFCRQYSSTYN